MWQGEQADCGSEWGISVVDEIVKIAGHSSLEGVHHNFHLFLYSLYLCGNWQQSHIYEGWETYILSLQSARGVTTLQSLLISLLGAGILLVLFLSTVSCLPT